MHLFCRLTSNGRPVQKLIVGTLEVLVLRPSHSVVSGAYLAGYLSSMRLWTHRKPRAAYLIEGKATPGAPVYHCENFTGSIDERELGTPKAAEIGTLVFRNGQWDVALRPSDTRPEAYLAVA